MQMKSKRNQKKSVKVSITYRNGGSLGRNPYAQQVNSDPPQATTVDKIIKIGTWNARTLFVAGQLENVKQEMKRLDIDVLGICETRWLGNELFCSDDP